MSAAVRMLTGCGRSLLLTSSFDAVTVTSSIIAGALGGAASAPALGCDCVCAGCASAAAGWARAMMQHVVLRASTLGTRMGSIVIAPFHALPHGSSRRDRSREEVGAARIGASHTPTARLGFQPVRPVSGLAYVAEGFRLGCIAFPRACAVAIDAVSYRLPLRGQRRHDAIVAFHRLPEHLTSGATVGAARAGCQLDAPGRLIRLN